MVERSIVFDTPWCRLVEQKLSDGNPYYMLDVPDYVTVIARTAERNIVLVQQHRPVVGRDSVEFPSGHVDPGESPEAAGRRELLEETGMVARSMELLGVVVPDIGRLTNRMWCYFASDVTPATPHEAEAGITVLLATEHDTLAMATDGRIEHALNIAALFLALGKGRVQFGA
jgi:8-oxo-dGTP pyrophosphatase MutT (NUDIX family)